MAGSILLWGNAPDEALQVTDESAAEYAFVIGNRLPRAGKTTSVHLISLEGRFDDTGRLTRSAKDYTRFVSLHQWRFSCENHKHTFEGLLLHLNQRFVTDGSNAPQEAPESGTDQVPTLLRTEFSKAGVFLSDRAILKSLPPTGKNGRNDFDLWTITDPVYPENHSYTLRRPKGPHILQKPDVLHVSCDNPATLRLPRNRDEEVEIQLAAGFTFLPHQFRDGSQSYSWYRGPLVPGPTYIDLPLPSATSDALLVYDKRSGPFYTGYASAWELGRMLCLANSRISQALYQWKREHRRMLRHTDPAMLEKLALLPVKAPSGPAPPGNSMGIRLPRVVSDWFTSLRKLESVPFRYLVPDERMLPVESIRFFEIDPHWIDCLLDGAFSIGCILEGDHEHDKKLHSEQSSELRQSVEPENRYTGLLLRSAAVSGWPLMTVEATNSNAGIRNERVRFDRLAPDILLCLFKGAPTRYEIHLPRETVHFGVEAKDDDSRNFSLPRGVVLKGGRLNLKSEFTLNPATFALNMVAGVPKVIFERPLQPPVPPGPIRVT